MIPMDGALRTSGPRLDPQLHFLEESLKKSQANGKPLSDQQKAKIKELFKQYAALTEDARAKKIETYPLAVKELNKLFLQKLP